MARRTVTPTHSTKDADNNVNIDSGLRADIMRCQMESKNTLTQNGSLYVGVGALDDLGNAKTAELRSGSRYQCLKVINTDGDIGYEYLNWNNFNHTLQASTGSMYLYPGLNLHIGLTATQQGSVECKTLAFKVDHTQAYMQFIKYDSSSSFNQHIISFINQNGSTAEGSQTSPITIDVGYRRSNGFLMWGLYCPSSVSATPAVILETAGLSGAVKSSKVWEISNQIYAQGFNQTSDVRLKENITGFSSSNSILNLPIYKYDFIEGSKNQIGCMAQDLQKICPELVQENEDGYLTIQENKIVFLLLEEVKKLRKEVDELKKEH